MRIRTIKPEFFEDEEIAKLSPHTRLLFIACWCLADKNGVFENRPSWIKAKVFPYEEWEAPGKHLDISQLLHGLVLGGFLFSYNVGGKDYYIVRNFRKHQRISGKETESQGVFPVPQDQIPPREAPGKHPGSTREASGCPGKEGNGKEQGMERNGNLSRPTLDHHDTPTKSEAVVVEESLKLEPEQPKPDDMTAAERQVVNDWNTMATFVGLSRVILPLGTKRRKGLKERIKDGMMAHWSEVVKNVKETPFLQGKNKNGWKLTFEAIVCQPDMWRKIAQGNYSNNTQTGEIPF